MIYKYNHMGMSVELAVGSGKNGDVEAVDLAQDDEQGIPVKAW